MGSIGVTGAPGSPGADGLACWDQNANGLCDVGTEDKDNSGTCTVDDCLGATGLVGADGLPCWDLNANASCDLGTEDINTNGVCDVGDCSATANQFIVNGTSQQTGNFNITGNGTADNFTWAGLSTGARLVLNGNVPLLTLLAPQHGDGATNQVLRVRSSTNSAPATSTVFFVDDNGGFVASGQIGFGSIPASGAGWRMMWYPYKVAFRAGYADAGGQFDDAKIGFYSWAGGALSSAPGNYAFAMGNQNMAEAQCGIAMGSGNNVYGNATDGFATCGTALGLNNAVKDQAGVTLGQNNWSDGDAAVAIGYRTTADADYSMAMGYRASTNGHTGAKVFGDASTTDSIEAVANNEFAVRAAGGFRFRTNATLTTGCNLPAGSGVFSCASSRDFKENFKNVNEDEVLDKLAALPLTTWNYKDDPKKTAHLGPMAQDFYSSYRLGENDTSIGVQDLAGVALAATKALNRRTEEVKALREEVAEMKKELERLKRIVDKQKQ